MRRAPVRRHTSRLAAVAAQRLSLDCSAFRRERVILKSTYSGSYSVQIRTLCQLSLVLLACLVWPQLAAAAPVKIRPIAVTASKTWGADYSPWNVTDGNLSTAWNAGAYAPQWIEFDLGRAYSVRQISLQTEMAPPGNYRHQIWVGSSPGNLRLVHTFSGYGTDGQYFNFGFDTKSLGMGNVRYVRIVSEQSASWIAWKEISVFQGVEYFGFYHDAVDHGDVGNYMAETAANGANLTWIGGETVARIAPKLTEASQRGLKAMVDIDNLIRKSDGTLMAQGAELDAIWNSVRTVVQQAPAGLVAGFYLRDEPYLGLDDALKNTMKSRLTAVRALIRRDFPSIPVAVIVSVPELSLDSSYFAMFDWVGYDCYQACTATNHRGYTDALRSKLTPSQRMIAVPWAYRKMDDYAWAVQHGILDQYQDGPLGAMVFWQDEVLADPKYVMVAPFLWQHVVSATEDLVGTAHLPLVKERLYQWAKSTFANYENRVYPLFQAASKNSAQWQTFKSFDRNPDTYWNADDYPQQSIEAWFPGQQASSVANSVATRVSAVTLSWQIAPVGNTSQIIYGLVGSTWIQLATLNQYAVNGTTVTVRFPPANVRAIRVTTTAGPSWVAWREVEFYMQ